MNLIHLGFLAAGAAAMTLPIWIHLLLRQRARSVEIGSIRFVKQVVRRTRSRQRIQRYLLLLMRAIAVLLLGLLFARPFLPETPADGSTREVAILIDRSASMAVTGEDGTTAFEAAIRRARECIGPLGEQTRIHLGLFDASGVEPIALADLDSASPSSLGTAYRDAFAWATDLMDASTRVDRELLVFSDLQRLGVAETHLAGFPAEIPVRIEDPSPPVAQNLAIEWVAATQVEIRPGMPVTVDARVVNHGAIPTSEVPVKMELDGPGGSISLDRSISLAAGQRTTVRWPLPIDAPGTYYGAVRIDYGDPYRWDDLRSVAFEVRHPDRILLIDGDAGEKSWESETYFLETALRLETPVGEGPARTFEVERLVWDRGSGFPDLSGFRLIVAAGLHRLTRDDASRLRDFVEAGGHVLWFPGPRSTEAVHENLIASGLLGDSKLSRATDVLARVSEFDASHPALKPFADPQHGDLRRLVANRLVVAEPVDAETQVLMRSRRFPLILSHPVGSGRFVFVATSADRGWSQWPQHRLYVPLIRQLAGWLTDQFEDRPVASVQTIRRPDRRPGVHSVDAAIVAYNVDSDESQIARLTPEQFRETTGLPEGLLVTTESDRREQLVPEGASRPDERWPWVVWALIGLLGSELILASRVHE